MKKNNNIQIERYNSKNIFKDSKGADQPYDNTGAQAEVEKMMKRGDKLSVKFGTTKDLHPYAWIESKNVAGFKYLLNRSRLIFLVRYIDKGEIIEYAGDPMQSDTLKEGEDYQLYMLKQFIEGGQKLQYTPLFREYNDKISAQKAMFKGTVFFRVPRTKENLDYLREKNQPI
jgi:hypothetical protein